jgi:molecular chaperone GrpE
MTQASAGNFQKATCFCAPFALFAMTTPEDSPLKDFLNGDGLDAAAPVADALPQDLAARLAELEAKHVEMSDAYLRAKADAENIRRRAEEETAKARKFAIESFADALLPVRDSLEAALTNGQAAPDKLLEGVETTLRQLTSAFERNKLVEIAPPAGTKFDPHQHQAIGTLPSEQEPNTIVSVLQKGYRITDRMLRPALVMVSAPKS